MAKNIVMPKLGMTQSDGTIIAWKKEVGSQVKIGEVLVIIESDKLTLDYESPEEGTLLEIAAPVGAVLEMGALLCTLSGGEEAAPGATAAPEQTRAPAAQTVSAGLAAPAPAAAPKTPGGRVKAVPMVRKMARDRGLDITAIAGTGPAGRITKADVLRAAEAPPAPSAPLQLMDQFTVSRVIPLAGMRGTIARKMTQSIVEAPQGTQFLEVDATEMLAVRELLAGAVEAGTGHKLSLTAVLIKSLAKALGEHDLLNSVVEDGEIRLVRNINIGVAVAVEGGLQLPVIHNAQALSLMQITARLADVSGRARQGKLTSGDLENRTFTLTNLGMYGTAFFTPLLTPPESAAIGVGAVVQKPVVREGEAVIRPMLPLSLTMDHRSVDGVPGAAFMATLKKLVETPVAQRISDINY